MCVCVCVCVCVCHDLAMATGVRAHVFVSVRLGYFAIMFVCVCMCVRVCAVQVPACAPAVPPSRDIQ